MSVKTIAAVALSLTLIFCAAPLASAGKGEKGEKGPIARIIKHATELSLTADQISKLEALEKEPHVKGKEGHKELREKVKAILTADQLAQVKKMMEEHKKSK